MTPQSSRAIETLGAAFYDAVEPARFPQLKPRWLNRRALAEITDAVFTEADQIARFGRFERWPGSLPQPLALRYHGHQFRQYNPEIGDGRGFLYAQVRSTDRRLLDLGTKGSGTTPYSRFGDGRLTLKGAVRELLATEMLEALQVPTSRTLSIIETGEQLARGDEPSPTRSAVLVRLSHGHIRIGTFQRLAYLGETAELARLVAYVRRELHGADDANPVALLATTAAACARTLARIMAAGFVHGVLNTDNINVTGESFDYGPWRFLPRWDLGFTAAYFDHAGLYAFGRQPETYQWNLLQLAKSLRLLAEADALLPALQAFAPAYEAEMAAAMLARLGVMPRGPGADVAALTAMERALGTSEAPLDRFWFDWRGGRPRAGGYDGADWDALRDALSGHGIAPSALDHPYWSDAAPQSLLIDEVEAIWSAIADHEDWRPLEVKIAAVRRMGEAYAPPATR